MRSVLALAVSAAGIAVNDFCEGALPVTASGISGTNVNTWSDSYVSSGYHDVFYSYNASCSGKATANLASSASNLKLSVYWGSTCHSLHNVIDSGTGTSASVDFNVRDQEIYYLSVASTLETVTASFSLNVVCVPAVTPLTPGDFCGNANTLTNGANLVSNAGATASGFGLSSPSSATTNRDLWYRYNATCTGKANFLYSQSQSNLDVIFASFEFGGSCDNVGASTYGNRTDSQPQQITIPTTEGQVSYIVLAAYSDTKALNVGDSIGVECIAEPRPSNDRCFEAAPFVAGVNISGTTEHATDAPSSSAKCGYAAVWYHTTATCTGTLQFDIESDVTAYIQFFDEASTCTDLSSVQGCSSSSDLSFPVQNGSSYYFTVYRDNVHFNLSATCIPSEGGRPVNDVCTGAIALMGDVNAEYSNVNATKQINTRRCPASGAKEIDGASNSDVWFVHTPNCSGYVTITVQTNSSSFSYPHIIALSGGCASASRPASCTEDLSYSATTMVPTVSGVPYYFAVATYSSSQGTFSLATTCLAVTSAPTAPTTLAPTAAPNTAAPSNAAPSNAAPSTAAPSSSAAPTPKGTTLAPTTRRPTNVGETYAPTIAPTSATTINGAAQAVPALVLLAGALAL